jgi:anti-sigma regulatory factor (Ser/Thr protein kinase)
MSDGDAQPLVIAGEFEPVPESASLARDLVRRLQVAGDTLEALMLIVSELATNAIRHARTRFNVALEHRGEAIRVKVTDTAPGLPELRDPAPTELGGRGMLIVSTVADRWGVEPQPVGKTVWAEVTLADDQG